MLVYLADDIFTCLRTGDHVRERLKERCDTRSKRLYREVSSLESQLDKINTVNGVHQYLPVEMWWELSNGCIATISNKWDKRHNRKRLYVSTILNPGMEPGGEKFTPHLLRRALQRLQERRSAFLWGLVSRLRNVAQSG